MIKNSKKTVLLRDSGNGQFISRQKAEAMPRNTWQKEQVPVRKQANRRESKSRYRKRNDY
jgi:hypothetical protein